MTSFFPFKTDYLESTSTLVLFGILQSGEDAVLLVRNVQVSAVLSLPENSPPFPSTILPDKAGVFSFYPFCENKGQFVPKPLRGARVYAASWKAIQQHKRNVEKKTGCEVRMFDASKNASSIAMHWLKTKGLNLCEWWSFKCETSRYEWGCELTAPCQMKACDPQPEPPLLRVAAFDIETNKDTDEVVSFNLQVALVQSYRTILHPLSNYQFQSQQSEAYQGDCPKGHFRQVPDEKALLSKLTGLLQNIRPHILSGYNIGGFDIRVVIQRLIANGDDGFYQKDSPMCAHSLRLSFWPKSPPTVLKPSVFQSKGKGTIRRFTVQSSTTIVWDLLQYFSQNDYKLNNLKLKTVTEAFLDAHTKDPLEYNDIVPFLKGPYAKRLLVHKYNKKDVDVVLHENGLLVKLDLITFMFSELRFFNFDAMELASRGATLRSEQQISEKGMAVDPPVLLELRPYESKSEVKLFAYGFPKLAAEEAKQSLLKLKEDLPADARFGLRRTTEGNAISVLVTCRQNPDWIKANKLSEYVKGEEALKVIGGICYPPCPAPSLQSSVCVLDFNSFYPSCMIAEQMCSQNVTTIGQLRRLLNKPAGADETCLSKALGARVRFLKNSYVHIKVRNQTVPPLRADVQTTVVGEDSVHLYLEEVPHDDMLVVIDLKALGRTPIMAVAAEDALDRRAHVKKQMKLHPKGSDEHRRLDSLQLLYKIVGNSLYGQLLGAGAMAAPLMGAAVTGYCRKNIIRAMMEACRTDWSRLILEKDRPECVDESSWRALLAFFHDHPNASFAIRYGDTDSIMVHCSTHVISATLTAAFAAILEDHLNVAIFKRSRYTIEVEALYQGMLCFSAKNYTALELATSGKMKFELKARPDGPISEMEDGFWLFLAKSHPVRVYADDQVKDEVLQLFAFFQRSDDPHEADVCFFSEERDVPQGCVARFVKAGVPFPNSYALVAAVDGAQLAQAARECVVCAAKRPDALRHCPKVKLKSQKRSISEVVRKANLRFIGTGLLGLPLHEAVRFIRNCLLDGFFNTSEFFSRVKVGKRKEEYGDACVVSKLLNQNDEDDEDEQEFGNTLEFYYSKMYDEMLQGKGKGKESDAITNVKAAVAKGDLPEPSSNYFLAKSITTLVKNTSRAMAVSEKDALAVLYTSPANKTAQKVAALFTTNDVVAQMTGGITSKRLDDAGAKCSSDAQAKAWFDAGRAKLSGTGPWRAPELALAFGGVPEDCSNLVPSAKRLRSEADVPSTYDRAKRRRFFHDICTTCVKTAHPDDQVVDIESVIDACKKRDCKTYMDREDAQIKLDEYLADQL